MSHKNYGAASHANTGYTNHTNSYNNHTNYYSNHTNYYSNHTNNYSQLADSYSNYTQRLYSEHNSYNNHYQYNCSGYSDYRVDIEMLDLDDLTLNDEDISTFYSQSGYYYNNHKQRYEEFEGGGRYEQYSNYKQYQNHTQNYHVQSSYAQAGYNNGPAGYNQAGYNNGPVGYNQAGYANMNGSQYEQYAQEGYNNHSNSGYTNHVNTTTNIPPTKPANLSRGASAYYKSTITLTWQRGVDNNKAISVVSRNTVSGTHADNGIWENTVLKQAAVRSWAAAYWNPDGSFGGSTSADVYGNASTATTFETWLINAESVANRTIAVLGFDEPWKNASGIINLLKTWGFDSLNAIDGSHFVFCGISTSKVAIRSQQAVRRFGTSDVRVASASYTISGVGSAQPLQTDLEYAFKPIGGSYGSWTAIGTVDGESYNYNLSNHGNGHIKFRARMSDHVETSEWIESSEVRVLKYDAPSGWTTTVSGTSIANTDAESLKIEINKLCSATGNTQSSVGNAIGVTVQASHISDFRNKLNAIGASISKTNLTDTNTGLVYAADVQNIKNWIKGV